MSDDKQTVRDRMGFGSVPITEAVDGWGETDDSMFKASKTLLEADEDNIKLRTDLSDEEIKIISKLKYFHELVDIRGLDGIVTEFMMLKVSRNRQSRKEFGDAFKNANTQRQGFMGGLFNRD